MAMNIARFIATGRWSDAAGRDAASGRGLQTAEVAFWSAISHRSRRPRLVCTWQIDPIRGRPVAVWRTRT